ncbi:hypothetical protein RN2511_042250 [Rhodococcus sp. NKCM2511]|nr:hypothetical protein RN2511_042250 [Rhodococcus sp. NKCM2511]
MLYWPRDDPYTALAAALLAASKLCFCRPSCGPKLPSAQSVGTYANSYAVATNKGWAWGSWKRYR